MRHQPGGLPHGVRSPGAGKKHRGVKPQRPGAGTLHIQGISHASRRPNLGGERARTRQHVFLYLTGFFARQLCDSLFTRSNLAAGCVTLFSIDLPEIDGAVPQQHLSALRKILERCISAGRELLLPAMSEAEAIKTFFVVACAEMKGEEGIKKCFRRELENFYHGSNLQPVISATGVQLSPDEQPWEARKAEVVNRIDKLIQAHVRERSTSN